MEIPKQSHISSTQLLTYVRCPEHYLFRYVLGVKIPPARAAVRGRAIHSALEAHYNGVKEGKGLTDKQAQEVYREELKSELEVHAFEMDEAGKRVTLRREFVKKAKELGKRELVDTGVKGLGVYFTVAPEVIKGTRRSTDIKPIALGIKPDLVEAQFRVPTTEGLDLLGYIDLTDTRRMVHETKSVGRGKNMRELLLDPQLAMYQIGYEYLTGKKPRGYSKDFIVFTKEPKVQRFVIDAPAIDSATMLRYIWNILKAIQGNVWYCLHPADTWICSKEWCGYHTMHQELREMGLEKMIDKYGLNEWDNPDMVKVERPAEAE